jgi:two-component system C4-dicarboxylate transport response regulator DctD
MPDALKVVFVEDDPAVRFGAVQALRLAGLDVAQFETAEAARAAIYPYFPGVLVADIKLPRSSGRELMRQALEIDPALPVILITGHGDISMAVQAMRDGAYDFIEKPFASDYLVGSTQRALEKRKLTFEVEELRRKLEDREGIERVIVGQSAIIEELRRMTLRLSEAPADALIRGETGNGKELVAYCLHHFSPRRDRHFVAMNCGAIPETMFESEVFGHEAGAFTGAAKRRIGKIEHAHGGTLFLDEIDSLPLSMQVKLLRALQERKVERLGSNQLVDVDVRVIAATKVDLEESCQRGQFRWDLYFRLNVITLDVPPLRDRREDIPLLFEHFVLQAATRYQRVAPMASPRLMLELMAHSWPGNVRELRNIADRFVLGVLGRAFHAENDGAKPLSDQVDEFERSIIMDQLRRARGNVGSAAEALTVPRKTLYDKIHKHGISLDWFR